MATMRDRAAVNNVAIQTLKIVFPKVFDIGCFSHTLDHVGEKFKTPILDSFSKTWLSMFSRSPKTRLAWTDMTNLSMPTYSPTRWWSKWEVLKQVYNAFGDVRSFLEKDELHASRSQMLEILNDPPSFRKLQLELAVVVEAGEPFVKATYNLGDGPLVFNVYKEILTLESTVALEHYPSVCSLAAKLASGISSRETQLINYAKVCVKPGYDYFKTKFGSSGDLKVAVFAFKLARYFDPAKIAELKPSACDIDELCLFPFFDSTDITNLKGELPLYLATATDVSPDINKIEWWKRHEEDLPQWSKCCKMLLLIQPSSAAAERVFSILTNSFNYRQEGSLRDYIETSVMLQYNYK